MESNEVHAGGEEKRNHHPIQCWCGTFRATLLNPRAGNRVVCYCRDCQTFAHALGQAERVLDASGGSDIVQVLPKNITIVEGLDTLTCMRLTPRGLLRWYTNCCRTPIGNTLANPKLSFIGLVHACLGTGSRPLDEVFGPVSAWVHTRSAKGDSKPHEVGRGHVAGWFVRTVLKARFNGDYRRSPLFQETGVPIVTPRILDEAELARVRELVRSASI